MSRFPYRSRHTLAEDVEEHLSDDFIFHDVDRRGTAYALKGILALASFRQAVGAVRLPGSLESGPDIFGQTAASALCIGCLLSIFGIFWQSRRGLRRRLDGLVAEQVGLVGVFVGCFLYVIALTLTVRSLNDAAFAGGLSLGLAVAAVWQYRSIRKYRRRLMGTVHGR